MRAVPLSGLTDAEAAERLAADGPNELLDTGAVRPWTLLLAQFRSALVWLLIGAGGVSVFLGETADAAAILSIVVLNACIGFYQEYGAERSIAALKKLTAPQAKVVRGGRILLIPASAVVRGDLLVLEAGDLVAADARLVDASGLRCAEAALTGESEPVVKSAGAVVDPDAPLGDRIDRVFMGTHVAGGAGRAEVVSTGMSTEIGRIADLLESADGGTSPLQESLSAFGRLLAWISIGIIALIFAVGMARGIPFMELFLSSISLAVAAVPEGLPAVITVALALGVRRMARRNALIRRLPAVETLGSAGVICTDKTGTLTMGEMTVRELFVAGKAYRVEGTGLEPVGRVLSGEREPDPAGRAALERLAWIQSGTVTASLGRVDGRWTAVGDPTEGAMLSMAAKLGVTPDSFGPEGKLLEYPFDSDRKRASVIRRMPGSGPQVLVNGAPDMLLALCTRVLADSGPEPLGAEWRERILSANADMAGRALRVLGTAYKEWTGPLDGRPDVEEVEDGLVFAGLTGMYDPPRPEAARAVARCREAGIQVVMITGDHPDTARAVAGELGLGAGGGVLTGKELDRLDQDGLGARIGSTQVFARVSAEHKLRIVRAWKSLGAVVAMTGDGVNDAPALKGADIGVAMGRTGTEVTKQASDMVVTDDNFASIVAAVEEGRGVYANIRKTLGYLLAGNAGELILMLAAGIAGLPAPLLPIHLLWINLVTDGLPALCLASEPVDPDVMGSKPRPRAERLADAGFIRGLLFCGVLTAGVSLAAFLHGLQRHGIETARSYAFATLVCAELFRSLGARSDTRPVWRMDLFGNPRLLAVVAASLAVQWAIHGSLFLEGLLKTTPIPPRDGLALVALSLVPFLVLEGVKAWGPRRR